MSTVLEININYQYPFSSVPPRHTTRLYFPTRWVHKLPVKLERSNVHYFLDCDDQE